MSLVEFKNGARVYHIALGALEACSQDDCVKCICTESVRVRVSKRLKKLKRDLDCSQISDEKKRELAIKVDNLLRTAEGLPLDPQGTSCLMTLGICKIPKCITANISEMLNLANP